MSKPILIQAPSMGLNTLLPANMISDRESPRAKNVLFSNGIIKTPYGFAKLATSGLPLNSGDQVTGIVQYTETDGTEHLIVTTTDKIYQKDNISDTWSEIVINDLTNNVLISNLDNPVSFAVVPHTDGVAIDAGGNKAYQHLLVCDGGLSPIQRWAGKYEEKFYSLLGADGYHETDSPVITDHYAKQVNIFHNHIILLSPKTWDATAGIFRENPQMLLWGQVGKLEGSIHTVTEATRASNVVTVTTDAAHGLTTGQTIVIAGTTAVTNAFNGRFTVTGSPTTTTFTYNQTGADETTTAGGTASDSAYDLMATGTGYNNLVDTGDSNVWSKQLGNQMIIYQKHSIWSMSHVGGNDIFRFRCELPDLGLLAPHLLASVGNRHYFIGNDFNLYEYSGGTFKQRIGDNIRDGLKNEIDFSRTNRCWMAIGANTSRLWIFYIPEGGDYMIKAYGMDLKTGAWMQREFSHVWTDSGITAIMNVGAQSYITGESYQQAITSGQTYDEAITATTTYREVIQDIMVDERLTLGDSEGNIYQYDSDLTTDNGINVPAYFVTKIFDYGMPDLYKWWEGLTVVAKGEKLVLSYRISDFETDDDGWNDFDAVDLTDEYKQHSFFFDGQSSLQIQFKFSNYQGSSFRIREFKIHAPTIEDSL